MNKIIHRAVRRDLRRFIDALERFPAGDRARAEQLNRAWQNFEAQLTHHHVGEHEIAWPALTAVGVSSELIEQMDAEHDLLAAALKSAGAAIAQLRRTASAQDAEAARASFEHLQEVIVGHLDHEEAELEPVYLGNRDHPAIKQMGRAFGKQRPSIAGTFFAWVSDGAQPDEMASLKASVPTPVRLIIGGVFGREYRRRVAPVWR